MGMVPAEGSLGGWLRALPLEHPEALAAGSRSQAAIQRAEAVGLAFHDPLLSSSAGWSDDPGEAPHLTLPRILPADALSAQAGIEAPLGHGVYGGLGAAQRRLKESGGHSDRWQTVVGGRLRLPLGRDRGYALTQLESERLAAEAQAVRCDEMAVLARLSHKLVLAYVAALRDVADAREVARAVERAEKLLHETSSRAELEVVAEYQVFPARFEAVLRKEELEAARQQIESGRLTLAERLGNLAVQFDMPDDLDLLLRWAAALVAAPVAEAGWARRRPEIYAAQARIALAEAAARAAAEELRDDFSIGVGLGWQSDERAADGDGSTLGFEAALIYARRWGRDGERAKLEAARWEVDEQVAQLHEVELQIAAEVAQARVAYEGACRRLALAGSAAEEARRVLAAEDERFAMGEGTSRNVLDAQKDLTSATRRHITVAREVVVAMADLRHALGMPPDALQTEEE